MMRPFEPSAVSFTPNTALDELVPPNLLVPAGGGVNAALTFGAGAKAIGLVGEPDLSFFTDALTSRGIEALFVPVPGLTRVLTYRADETYDHPKLTRHGFSLDHLDRDWYVQQICDLATDTIHPGDWAILSGSLPQGLDAAAYVRLAECAVRLGAQVFLDGPPEFVMPAVPLARVIKLNRRELLRAAPGVDTTSYLDLLKTAAGFLPEAGIAAFTLGPDGTIMCEVSSGICRLWHLACDPPRKWRILSRRGAGDAFDAACTQALMHGSDTLDAGVDGVAAATATLLRRPGDNIDRRKTAALRRRVKLRYTTSATREELVAA